MDFSPKIAKEKLYQSHFSLIQRNWALFDFYDVVWGAMEDLTELFKRVHGNALVVLEIMDGMRIDVVFVDKGVCGNFLLFHGFP